MFVGQPFPLSPLESLNGSFPVLDLPVIPTELELVAVPLEMLLREVVEDAVQPALHEREVAFGRVRVGVATHILFLFVVDDLVASLKLFPDAPVGRLLIGHDRGALIHQLPDRALQRLEHGLPTG